MNYEKKLDYLLSVLISEHEEAIEIPNDLKEKRKLLRALMNLRPPLLISEEYLKVQDDLLSYETKNKKLTEASEIETIAKNSKLALWQGDITTLAVDGIVNAANNQLMGCFIPLHNCIDNIIHSAAGLQLREDCYNLMKAQGELEPIGRAKITKGYNLPSKYVIHTVGPSITGILSEEECKQLESCYFNCLKTADENKLKSIAFSSISTGVFNFPKDKAAEIAIETSTKYLKDHPDTNLEKIIFDVFSDNNYQIYKKTFKKLIL